jgi:hypothetical protein
MVDVPTVADTILAADFGTATTRVALFEVVEGVYRFVAHGEASSTVEPPYLEASEGLRHALAEMQAITGRVMLDENSRLIIPSTADGRGADVFVATSSAGPAVRTVLVGLLPDVSLESARRVAATSYLAVKDTFSLGDTRREDQQIDAVIAAHPQMLLIAGGTDGGATEALTKLIETVSLACHLLPGEQKVRVLYAGNSTLKERISELMQSVAAIHTAPNLTPELGAEDLGPARLALGQVVESLRLEQIGGFQTIAQWAGGRIFPTAQAEGEIIRYFSKALGTARGVLGVNVGSASTSVAAAIKGQLHLTVRPDLGVGVNATQVLKEWPLDQFTRWLPEEVSNEAAREFILNKSLYPHSVPPEPADLHLEHALARQVLRAALRRARRDWPSSIRSSRPDLLPAFEWIIAGGAALANAPTPAMAAMLLLDALQPVSLTTLFLDGHQLLAALGALAHVNPTASIQLLDSILSLGTMVSVVGNARPDDVVCTAILAVEGGEEQSVEVKFGALEILPLPLNKTGTLTLRPSLGMNVGFGLGRSRTLKEVIGGAVGVMIDARGRPLVWPKEAEKRRELVQDWYLKVGGI